MSQAPPLRLVAWEVTRACNLACKHCRAEACAEPFPGELTTPEAKQLIDSFPLTGNPIIIFTGGEPLLRKDIFELADYAKNKGLRSVMASNGTLIEPNLVRRLNQTGIQRVSISLDGPDPESHDAFRGVNGAFDSSIKGIKYLRESGFPFQINTTITKNNLNSLPEIFRLAKDLDAVAWHIFLLVPMGRASSLQDEIISAEKYEQVLNWFYEFRKKSDMHLKATCAPHYHRILRQRAKEEGLKVNYKNFGLDAVTRGCLGGLGFCFISHSGQVQPCGYLELDCGQIRDKDFPTIWSSSKQFLELRTPSLYKGKCGQCEYHYVCGGCRARAYAMNGDYLAEEPLCTYQPKKS